MSAARCFLVDGDHPTEGTGLVPITERPGSGGRSDADRETTFVLAVNGMCADAEERLASLERASSPGHLEVQAAVVHREAQDLIRFERAAAGDQVAELYALTGAILNVSNALRSVDNVVRSRAPRRAITEARASLARAQRGANQVARHLGVDCTFR